MEKSRYGVEREYQVYLQMWHHLHSYGHANAMVVNTRNWYIFTPWHKDINVLARVG